MILPSALTWKQSLSIFATVTTRNEKGRWVVVDCGQKAITPTPVRLFDSDTGAIREDIKCENGGDEHFILKGWDGPASMPSIGQKLHLAPGHCDPTFNMHDFCVAYRGDTVVECMPIARGPGH